MYSQIYRGMQWFESMGWNPLKTLQMKLVDYIFPQFPASTSKANGKKMGGCQCVTSLPVESRSDMLAGTL